MIAEILGPSGRVHYRRPFGDPLIKEAAKTKGYVVRYVERETVEETCQHCHGEREIETDNNGPIVPCGICNGRGWTSNVHLVPTPKLARALRELMSPLQQPEKE